MTKGEFCREWYAKGKCPGCGGPLEWLAGEGMRHTAEGRIYSSGFEVGKFRPSHICEWSADALTSLVLIGSGVVKSNQPSEREGQA